MFLPTVLLVVVLLSGAKASPRNEFGSIQGCLQYNSDGGYYADHPFFTTSSFQNIETDGQGTTKLRFGVVGEKHAAIRFTSVSTSSDISMTEIALSHWGNTRTDIRKYPRTVPKKLNSKHLGEFPMKNLMSIFKPVMMTIEIHRGGRITVTKDGESTPFLQFNDPTFSHQYIGFARWDVPVAFFYDCPLYPAGGPNDIAHQNQFSCNDCPIVQPDCSKCWNTRDPRARCADVGVTTVPPTASPCENTNAIKYF